MPQRARWQEIAAAITDGIRAGRYQVGGPIRSQSELAADFDVSLGTVVAAVRWLRSRGVLDTVPGKGVHVARQPMAEDDQFPVGDQWRRAVDRQLADHERRLTEIERRLGRSDDPGAH